MTHEAIAAVIAAARAYSEWARETGDYPHDEAGCRAHEALLAAVRALDGGDSLEPMTFVGGYGRLQEVTRAAARDPNSNRQWSHRSPSPWWKS